MQEADVATPAAQGTAQDAAGGTPETLRCLSRGGGYLRARISGTLQAELDWDNEGTSCTGAVRPGGAGIRMRFSRPGAPAGTTDTPRADGGTAHGGTAHGADDRRGHANDGADRGERTPAASDALVLVFGITGLREGRAGRNVPVNLTVIREGHGQFYSTQGDDKCMLDEVTQTPLAGVPRRSRSYRIEARGFCTEPARAVHGQGVILMSRFDFSAQVDFDAEESQDDLR